MKLEPLLVLRIDAGAPVGVGAGPYGTRLISTAAGETFEGAGLRGRVLPNGGDWILVDGEDVWMRAALAGGSATNYAMAIS